MIYRAQLERKAVLVPSGSGFGGGLNAVDWVYLEL